MSTAHFTDHELGADQPDVTSGIAANLQQVASWLEAARAVLGVPLRVTSGYRSAQHNAAIGGAPDSDHVNGLAADFVPVGLTKADAYGKLSAARDAGQLPAFDQLIYYALDDHVHIGLGAGMREQVLVEDVEGGVKRYRVLTAQLAAELWGAVPDASGDDGARRADAPAGPVGGDAHTSDNLNGGRTT